MINTIFLNRLDDFKNLLSPSVRLGEIIANVFIVLFNTQKNCEDTLLRSFRVSSQGRVRKFNKMYAFVFVDL